MSEEAPEPARPALKAPAAPAQKPRAASDVPSPVPAAQMTASCLSPAADGKWVCEVCTYENFPLSRKCTMCQSSKPVLGEDIFRLQDGASALPATPPASSPANVPPPAPTPPPPSPPSPPQSPHSPHATGAEAEAEAEAEAVSERLRPLRISSPPAGASAAAKWACPTCTYENWPKSLKCAMCGSPATAATHSLHSPHSPPHPTVDDTTHDITPPPDINELASSVSGVGRRRRRTPHDWLWLQACLGVVEDCKAGVEAYLAAGGDPARALTPREVAQLDRASAFDAGHTLVHLAIRFQRQEILTTLLSRISGGGSGLKRSPSYIAPELAEAIRRQLSASLRPRKAAAPAPYIAEICTFYLPAEITSLPLATLEQLYAELLDGEVQAALEGQRRLNWAPAARRTGRLLALWNRSNGDCLPDAVCQAAYGTSDRRNSLRASMHGWLLSCRGLATRWGATERRLYRLHDQQLRADWARVLHAATTPHAALSQIHVFALAHVMRRPIIVYGIDVVHSFRGEALGYARFQGIYLPLEWERSSCSGSPLCLAYTRGHFSALVPLQPYAQPHHYICREEEEEGETTLVPLTDCDGKMLPVHFLVGDELENSAALVRRWTNAVPVGGGGGGGLLCASQPRSPRPLLVAQMTEEWLNHYRRLAQQTHGPHPPRPQLDYSSGPDTDDD